MPKMRKPSLGEVVLVGALGALALYVYFAEKRSANSPPPPPPRIPDWMS